MRYTTRVELHRASENDYEELHAAMESEGFSRLITDREGVEYHLPTAEYNFIGKVSVDDVIEKAKRAAASTNRKYMVIVTESNRRRWHNLPLA